MTKYVYSFSEGNKDLTDLLGGKGANLAEMANLGLPVPPGFTITTQACRIYFATGREPAELAAELAAHLDVLEQTVGKRLGDPHDPLLVSVRSGAAASMPGMMETVLDVGLNDDSVHGLARVAGNERFAWDSYRRLIQMFGRIVLGIEGKHFDRAFDEVKQRKNTEDDLALDTTDLRHVVDLFKTVVRDYGGREFSQDPCEQLHLTIRAVFESWNSPRAITYRRQERISGDLGTAVSVMSMVFGNLGPDSGTGVAFTRDPGSGEPGIYGDYLPHAQGEDVVAGIRNTLPLTALRHLDQHSYQQLLQIMTTLEGHYRDLCDIEFTIERGKLWILQTRVGKRTAGAAFRVATQLVDEGLVDLDEALRRVTGAQLAQLMFPRFVSVTDRTLLTRGMGASPGAATGRVVFDSATAMANARAGQDVLLVRRETNADDLDGMIAARGVLTSRGGRTSHAAVVARGMGKTCVCGAEELEVDAHRRRVRAPDGRELGDGDVLSIDGSTGEVFLGAVPVVPSSVVEYFEGALHPDSADADDLVRSVHRLLTHADTRRRLRVRGNADTAADCARARRFGAEGIGLCRTEHMFLGERRRFLQQLVLATSREEREQILATVLDLQRADFTEIFEVMAGQPVTIRLLDPPLHEFLPDITELSVRVALARVQGDPVETDEKVLSAVRRLHEVNPMLGLRGVRLGLVVPGLFAMQVRAIAQAAVDLHRRGIEVAPEIMIPLVSTVAELRVITVEVDAVLTQELGADRAACHPPIGTMIELPRAALTAGQIAGHAQFFSFGTNDLTQTTWGFSRDDVEGTFFPAYLDGGILGVSPFESVDLDGVGRLIRIGAEEGRAGRPDLKLGVCGEHGGDPDSIHFFHTVGLDYVSCSPFRIPIARLEAGRAALIS